MSIVKKQLVAQDLNRVKQILSMVEEGVTNEVQFVSQGALRMEPAAEYIFIKRVLLGPYLADAIASAGVSESDAALSVASMQE